MILRRAFSIAFVFLLLSGVAVGHGAEEGAAANGALTGIVDSFVPVSGVAFLALLLVSGAAVLYRGQLTERGKKTVFGLMVLLTVIPTAYMFLGTVYVNATSFTGGEVHWHADFRVYVDGQQRELVDPQGTLSNRVGTPEFHEHDDNRIHAEGIFQDREDVTLHRFFESIGGRLNSTSISFQSTAGQVDVTSNGKTLKAFVKRGLGGDRAWETLENPGEYVISPYSQVPPGDRIVIVYDGNTTEQILQDLQEDDRYGG